MKRITCFAHYDKNNEIQDYVVYYLKELKKASDTIIFVSDTNLLEEELQKIKPYIDFEIVGTHGEYDFGSYKRGYLYAKDNGFLNNCEELIFANDSCYAPLFSFEDMFNKMSSKDIDFWGITENYTGIKGLINPKRHIQSYFMVFKPQVFNSECFYKFISEVTKQESKLEIIAKYEIGLTQLLVNSGFKYDIYMDITKENNNMFLFQYRTLISKYKNLFLKRSIALNRVDDSFYPIFLKNFIKKYTSYDWKLIEKDQIKNMNRINAFSVLLAYIPRLIKDFRRFILTIHINSIEKKVVLFGITLYKSRKIS